MDDIMKKTEQRDGESSSNEQSDEDKLPKGLRYQKVHSWLSVKGKVDKTSTDDVDMVLLHIQERIERLSFHNVMGIVLKGCYVNFNVPVVDHKPTLISIGPKYRDKIKSDLIEVYKLLYTISFFKNTDTTLEQFLRDKLNSFKLLVLNSKSWNEWSGLDYALMEMFILDGCFIIELFRNYDSPEERRAEPLLNLEHILYNLSRDLILLDNQLPFDFLEMLLKIRVPSGKLDQHDCTRLELTRLALKFLERIVPNQRLDHKLANIKREDPNLLSIVYDGLWWLRPEANNNYNSNIDKGEKDGDDKWNSVKSATELQEFGVEFKMKNTDNLVDITFNKGVLHIPRIRIQYGTAFSINMLLEFENNGHFLIKLDQRKCLTNYLWFMNSLVKSPNDVQLLRKKNIIDNLSELPDDVAILKFLKDLYESLMISQANFGYKEICKNLNEHCSHRRNRWLAKLKRAYFNSPWAVISIFAGSLLLILTAAQTGISVFSVVAYYNKAS